MKKSSGIKSLFFLVLVMTFSSMLLTMVAETTKDIRNNHDKIELARKICISADLKDMSSEKELLNFFSKGKIIESKDFKIIDFRDESFSAVVFSGSGLWDQIYTVICVRPGLIKNVFLCDKLLGLQIIQQKETPGLGGRIEEKWFTDQFSGFSLKKGNPQIVIGRSKKTEMEIDGITGASMTCKFLQESLSNCIASLKKKYPSGMAQ
ncbi:FMN-binding protein [bacterium]|nr:FMN-binding protein [bacterium]